MLTQFHKKIWLFLLGMLFCAFVLLLTMCLSWNSTKKISIGAKNCTENRILAEIIAILIEKKTSLHVQRKLHMEGTFICMEALKAGDIDIYPEYTGSALITVYKKLHHKNAYAYLKKRFKQDFGICWLKSFGFSNHYVFAIDKKYAETQNIRTIGNLCDYAKNNNIKIAIDPEFAARGEWIQLQEQYPALSDKIIMMENALIVLSLKNGFIEVGQISSTSGMISSDIFIFLQEEKVSLPQYLAAPLIRDCILQQFPYLKKIINTLAGKITWKKMKEMNIEADNNKKKPYDIAYGFLKKEGLI